MVPDDTKKRGNWNTNPRCDLCNVFIFTKYNL